LSGQGRRLQFFYNLHSIVRNHPDRLKYTKDEFYVINDNQNKKFFISPKSAKWGFWNGIANRGISIGNGYFLSEIPFENGDLVIDCGAQVGDLLIYFENLGISIEYIGIEPSDREFSALVKNISPHKALNIGLWFEKATLEFFVSSLNADSSFIEPREFTKKLLVPVERLDNLESRHIKLLKLEAEGAEIEVLKGCEKILKNIDYISADCGFERGIAEENTISDVVNFLLARNFILLRAIAPSGRNTFLFKNSLS
jgi:FkbM family methyltransferase